MKPVLILTKNILNEGEFQQRIQQLNQEVFCSSKLLQILSHSKDPAKYLDLFSVIVISETIGEIEFTQLLLIMKDLNNPVIRLVSSHSEEDQKKSEEPREYRNLTKECSLECLRDLLQTFLQSFEQEEDLRNGLLSSSGKVKLLEGESLRFTRNERRFIEVLQKEPEKIHSRKEVCYALWEKEDNSTKSQLSCMTTRLNKKFKSIGLSEEMIETYWKKGYKLAPIFFEVWEMNNQFL